MRPGRALRVYQIIALLILGWLVGRIPSLLAEARLEQTNLAEALGLPSSARGTTGAAAAPAAGLPAAADLGTADLAARVAAQVAADVADATIARLLAAGWGPPGYRGASMPPQGWQAAPPARVLAPQETVVRIVTEARPPDPETVAALGWRLPPQPHAPAGANPRAASPGPTASTPREPDRRADAHALASRGYVQLKAGDRRAAVQSFSRALVLDPEAEQAEAWAAEVRRLTRRWAISAYSLSREGTSDALAAAPVLGGGQ
ncbi:MAG: hypothetical protein ACK4MX_07845, partial [Thermaurantiacus sp.]